MVTGIQRRDKNPRLLKGYGLYQETTFFQSTARPLCIPLTRYPLAKLKKNKSTHEVTIFILSYNEGEIFKSILFKTTEAQ
jgi:hypothetical protein